MADNRFDLFAATREEMIDQGFDPDFSPEVGQQLAALKPRTASGTGGNVGDLRSLLWSSIDNDTSRDLDQAEAAERVSAGIRLLIAIADLDSDVPIGSPIDQHAAAQTTSVYTGIRTFSMLPEKLSTDLTSLNQDADRLAVVVDMVVASDGSIISESIYRAWVRNQAQLTYNGIGPWLEGSSVAPPEVDASADLAAQLKLQDEAVQILFEERQRVGALNTSEETPGRRCFTTCRTSQEAKGR
jgi:exoribonuclease R